MELVLSGFRDVNRQPSWWDVEALLDRAQSGQGSVELENRQNGSFFRNVQLLADNHNYVLLLLDEDDEVRSLVDPVSWDNEQYLILGDYWGSAHVTRDFELVRKAFREFFDTGDVSREILN